MPEGVGSSSTRTGQPTASLDLLARLDQLLRPAPDVDGIVRVALGVVAGVEGICRAALALSEGGGRRLRYVDNNRVDAGDGALEWCHIDAYDDVPLTTVVRTGEAVHGRLDALDGRYAGLVEAQRGLGVGSLAALPLPGTGSPMGGLLVYTDDRHDLSEDDLDALQSAARRTAEAIRRVRLVPGREGSALPDEPDVPEGALATSVLLEGDPRATGAARRFLRHHLEEWGVDAEAVDDAQLCLSELVTNAVVHAGTASELRVVLDGGVLTVTVRDLGGLGRSAAGEPQPSPDADPLRVHGRGLQLVDALSDRWGSERDVAGTAVWFALELGDPAATA